MFKIVRFSFVVCLFFVGASLAFADVSNAPGAPTDPQPFGFYCGPYTVPFLDGGYYTLSSSDACTYELPAMTGADKFLAVYKGVVGSSTLLASDETSLPYTILQTSPDDFTGSQGDNFFTIAFGYDNFSDVLSLNSYLTGSSTTNPGLSYQILGWKWGTPPCSTQCYSNVLFLPGVEGSKLYDASNDEVWIPSSDSVADDLALNSSASSTDPNITTFDALSQTGVGQFYRNVYNNFLATTSAWQSTYGIIATTTPYDWRLDYSTLITNGRKLADGHITYLEGPVSGEYPYIFQTLQQLADSSQTGKVTIIAHSNGGLLAKALMQYVGSTETQHLIDKVIFIDVPQVGTSQTIGALLNGYGQSVSKYLIGTAMSEAEARKLAQNMPASYNLLPSSQYFSSVSTPVVTFDSAALPSWAATYGSSINSSSALRAFMTDSTRPTPSYSDTATPTVVNSTLFDNASSVHSSLDSWTPPSGVQLFTIAGWGNMTPTGIQYTKQINGCAMQGSSGCEVPTYGSQIAYHISSIIDGDGTVVASSSQWADGAPSTKYWVNLETYNCPTSFTCLPQTGLLSALRASHYNILEIPELQTLLSKIIINSTSSLPQYISITQPTHDTTRSRTDFFSHSPLTLGFTDSSGNYTGSTATTTIFNSPGVDYERFGEVQWLSVPASMTGQVVMDGTGTGSFALDVQSVNGDTVEATTTFAAVPCATSTIATLSISPSVSPTASSTLDVDENGDGTVDLTLQADQGQTVVPSPRVIFDSISGATVSAEYDDMPAGSQIVFVNHTSGTVVSGYRTPINGGLGSTTILIYGMSAGTYYLEAQAASSTYLAQSVNFTVATSSSPTVTYDSASTTGQTVTFNYANLPTNSQIVFVNNTSGQATTTNSFFVASGGTSSTTVSTVGITPYGGYHLKAQDATDGTYYAQSTTFYISDPNDDGGDGL